MNHIKGTINTHFDLLQILNTLKKSYTSKAVGEVLVLITTRDQWSAIVLITTHDQWSAIVLTTSGIDTQ